MNPDKPIRWQSTKMLLGRPLVAVAIGTDAGRGEGGGHARGVIGVVDVAGGWVALGGVAVGGLTLGGLSLGVAGLGGLCIGGVAVGGAALGGIAVGGAAIGIVAVGGAALGYFAYGGVALGKYVVSPLGRDTEAMDLFRRFVPWLISGG